MQRGKNDYSTICGAFKNTIFASIFRFRLTEIRRNLQPPDTFHGVFAAGPQMHFKMYLGAWNVSVGCKISFFPMLGELSASPNHFAGFKKML